MIAIAPYMSIVSLEDTQPTLIGLQIAVLHNELVVSSCYIGLRDNYFKVPLLMNVGTREEYRRRGFGHELMRGVEAALLGYSYEKCYLETGRTGHARHLYECHGWRAIEYDTWYGERCFAMEWRSEWIDAPTRLVYPQNVFASIPA